MQEGHRLVVAPRRDDEAIEIPTPYTGANRIRFEGLRSPALSAPGGAPLSYEPNVHPTGTLPFVILRMLRQPRAGRPSLLARAVALVVVLGLIGLTAPALGGPVVAALQWLGGLL